MCVRELMPKPALFPDGLPQLPPQISYHLYGPFFCQDNVYQDKFAFVNSSRPGDGTKDADPLPDASEAFYSALFQSELDKGVQMSNYEVDFLQDQTT